MEGGRNEQKEKPLQAGKPGEDQQKKVGEKVAITKVYLLNVPLESDYAHTLWFATDAAQKSYFDTRVKRSYTDFTYQRKDGVIRVPAHIDELLAAGCNYVMYQNTEYSNKWFYAFITGMEYKNDGATFVTIKTDVIQTWLFDYTVKPSFVEREHVKNDEFGEHTIDEGLELGEYVANKRYKTTYGRDLAIIVGVTKDVSGWKTGGATYYGTYSGVAYYAFNPHETNDLEKFVESYDQKGIAEDIVCMFLAPAILAAGSDGKVVYNARIPEVKIPHLTAINKADSVVYFEEVVQEFTTTDVNGYTPRNNKLLCYPYKYLLVSNNAGASVPYKYERFYLQSDTVGKTMIEPCFVISGTLTPGCSIRMVPKYYNGVEENHEEGINMGKFPILNWQSDVYTNWLTQNSVNMGIQVVSGIAQIGAGAVMAVGSGGLASGAGVATAAHGLSSIVSVLAQNHQQSFSPVQAKGNLNSGDIVTAEGDNTFHFYTMSVKDEVARVIDGFFDMYGYKCNLVKIPEKNHRRAYWYTKTIDANILGDVPQDDLQTIKNAYNNGITFWKNTSSFRDYSVNNAPV